MFQKFYVCMRNVGKLHDNKIPITSVMNTHLSITFKNTLRIKCLVQGIVVKRMP